MLSMRVLLPVLILFRLVNRALVDCESHTFDLFSLRSIKMHVELADGELGKFPLESGGTDAEIDQRAYGHVTTDAGDAVEIEDFHGGFSRIRVAAARLSDDRGPCAGEQRTRRSRFCKQL